jgi:hypothetical protein
MGSAFAPYCDYARWNLHALRRYWHFSGIPHDAEMIQHWSREHNNWAILLATKILSGGGSLLEVSTVQMHDHDTIVVSSAGTTCKGLSSAAACLHVYNDLDGWKLVGQCGIHFSMIDNVTADWEAACLGVRLVILFWLVNKVCS